MRKAKDSVATSGNNQAHLVLILSLGASLMLAAYPALADTVTTPRNVEFYAANGEDKSGEKDGAGGTDINYTNDDYFVISTATTAPTDEDSVYFLTTVGGLGVDEGHGGQGGGLTFSNNGSMTLNAAGSNFYNHIIYAKSLGGAGDSNNDNNDSNGGGGGNGGTVNVTNSGNITLNGALGYFGAPFIALRASTVGANGGNQNSGAEGDQYGGSGGSGGDVTITNTQAISLGTSTEDRAAGQGYGGAILAESLGGTGGNDNGLAGNSNRVTINNSAPVSLYWDAVSGDAVEMFAIRGLAQGGGGSTTDNDNSDPGGDGGGGGIVTVGSSANVTMDIANAPGIEGAAVVAQSFAGNGGKGPSKDNSGGLGGSAYNATINLTGDASVSTTGGTLYGLLAQSVGGQGGDGGDDDALAGQAGGGGYGGAGGVVTVTTDAGTRISTQNDYAAGIAAHSLGGGGGTGGDFVSVLGGQGGNGGNGGNAGTVTLTLNGGIATKGDHAYGALGQSIAGSGGTGGVETGGLVSLGGDGAGGGAANTVTVTNSGGISTEGYSAHGIVAHSIGGGGGAAGSASGWLSIGGSAEGDTGSSGGQVSVTNSGQITTQGVAAVGIVAQSIGGGGGTGGDATGIAGVGGTGSGGGSGSAVNIHRLGAVSTLGDYGMGVLAQSVGGGGGNGGDELNFSVGVSVGIGGSAEGGGNGGPVCISNSGSCGGAASSAAASITTLGDQAIGILAQSIGGGGGNGGGDTSYGVGDLISLQVGGTAGAGGSASSVNIKQTELSVTTSGAHASGIVAQSIGGGGGNGGSASSSTVDLAFTAAYVLGGSGGSGGSASDVTVALGNSRIITGLPPQGVDSATFAPNDAMGIVAQAIGGGGGNGGTASASDLMLAMPTGSGVSVSFNFQAAMGGNGGSGQNACGSGDCVVEVSLVDGTSVTTLGDGSHGVLAQSVGGGGGNGGDASVLSTSVGDGDSVQLTAGVSLGGQGGSSTDGSSHGGAVNVVLGDAGATPVTVPPMTLPPSGPPLASSIVTYGNYADAVLAQSVGGGGGNGGMGSSNAYSVGGAVSIKATVGLGGAGGGGGSGDAVTVTQNRNHTIQTLGSGSRGIVAQSIGGGGGTSQGGTLALSAAVEGEGARLSVGVGMTGGNGGNGGTINAHTSGVIQTLGGDADGVMAQSIGGGGGLGGSIGADASSHPILDRIGSSMDNQARFSDEGGTYTFGVSVGGKGGEGGTGGTVNLYHAGKISTQGDWADGIVAQSIGGGGGAGGSASASGSQVAANIDVAVGGSGGSGNDGGTVNYIFSGAYDGAITTAGYSAYGVLMQSIGGGGGQGGDGSDQAAGTLTIGGSDGGSGGASGSGGAIQVGGAGNWIAVTTKGSESPALVAQSIGGGGGVGGAGNSSSSSKPLSHSLNLSVGGQGGSAGNGGTVDLETGAYLYTYGDRSYGMVAQSIGGGGGLGSAGTADNFASVSLGGRDSSRGDGGSVAVNLLPGSIVSTVGEGAHAIIAQSIGGGGGIAGDVSLPLQLDRDAWGGSSGGETSSGNGHDVNVTVNGSIATTGDGAFGIIAQSISGGGGLGGDSAASFAGSNGGQATQAAGNVTVTQSGTIETLGYGSNAIFAQSVGPQGSGVIIVNIDGSVTGGDGPEGSAVWITGDYQNFLNTSSDSVIQALSGTAINYQSGAPIQQSKALAVSDAASASLQVNNAGRIYGNAECKGGLGQVACNVNNAASGVLSDATLYQANINNAGLVVIGKPGAFDTLSVTGDFDLQSAGILQADVDFDKLKSPRMVVLGDTRLDGQINTQPFTLLPEREVTVATLEGDIQGLPKAKDSPVIDYDARLDGKHVRVRAAAADFAAESMSLGPNQRAVAGHLQRAWDLGGNSAMSTLFASLDMGSRSGADAYGDMISDLSPGVSIAPAAQMSAGMSRFTGNMMSCPAFSGNNALTGEQNCFWGQVTGRNTNQEGRDDISEHSINSMTYQFGGQREFQPNWFVGGSAAYQTATLKADDSRVSGDGSSGYLGVVLKRQAGSWVFSGGLGAGYGRYDIDRNLSIPNLHSTASSSPDVFGLAARLRVARSFVTGNFYVKPYLDLDANYTRMSGYDESRGDTHLTVQDSDQFIVGLSPMIEVGGRVELEQGAVMRPFAYAGVSFLSRDSYKVKASLQGAPAGSGDFETSMPMDDVVGRLGAGLQISNVDGVDFRLQYDGEFSSHAQSHSGTLKIMVPF
ncbi:autotransporter [Pusillimonas sp. T7-7]|uniref:autotransporter outer membrane beta-barrel domain-containing protein n=1 Tax=Pusillimonas sp. (strain T7-7) TaxID=1007105 RepID=UPI0002085575|nr:autotransporter outer membrane beta-barrel domain-containing protein [Pusillimonas sp. T7-7]AEC20803.1 autotransporter [Pusillimonas sp. T7-7]